MIINDLDLGPSHPWVAPRQGQVMGSALIEGMRTIVWPRGATVVSHDVTFTITAWQAIGGQSANTIGAIRYLLQQVEELATNRDLQPVYIQWTNSAASGAFQRADEHDGWYIIENFEPNYLHNMLTGNVECRMTVTRVASAIPSSLAAWYSGAALASTYSSPASALISFPIGATGNPPTQSNRSGGEGTIQVTTSPVVNPLPFAPSATIANLFQGSCHVYDTINTGTNPIPVAGGTFINANWVEVKGTGHNFVGDCVVTNGLVLLLYQVGGNVALVYLWNTSVGPQTWQSMGTIQYQDNAGNIGTVRSISLDRVGLQEVRIRLMAQSATLGHWAMFRQKLQAGMLHVSCEFWALTQTNTAQNGLVWLPTAVYATGFTDATSSTTFPSNLATTAVSGYSAAQGSASSSPIFGWLYQNTPTTAQGRLNSTSSFGLGDTGGPAVGSFRLYGFFVVSYFGAVVLATAQGLVAPLFQQFAFDRVVEWTVG